MEMITFAVPCASKGRWIRNGMKHFLCNEDGEVKNWMEVAGGSGMNISDVITEISGSVLQKEVHISDVKDGNDYGLL